MRKKTPALIFLIFLAAPVALFSQVMITGPACVVSGTVYQYSIAGSWDSVSTMQVCVTGGRIADSTVTGSCSLESAPLGAVLITWDSASAGTVSLTSSKGNASLQVSITSSLQPGLVDEEVKLQMIDSGAVPHTISCSLPAGGACSPSYQYQWQKSENAVAWTDIAGATDQNLDFTDSPLQSGYYRRKTTEAASGTIGYSEPALVGINSPNN